MLTPETLRSLARVSITPKRCRFVVGSITVAADVLISGLLSGLSRPLHFTANHSLRLSADPNGCIGVDAEGQFGIMADFATLADRVATCQRSVGFGMRDIGRDQSIRCARGRVFDDADTGRESTQNEVMSRLLAAGERAEAETVAVERDLADRGVIGLPGA